MARERERGRERENKKEKICNIGRNKDQALLTNSSPGAIVSSSLLSAVKLYKALATLEVDESACSLHTAKSYSKVTQHNPHQHNH